MFIKFKVIKFRTFTFNAVTVSSYSHYSKIKNKTVIKHKIKLVLFIEICGNENRKEFYYLKKNAAIKKENTFVKIYDSGENNTAICVKDFFLLLLLYDLYFLFSSFKSLQKSVTIMIVYIPPKAFLCTFTISYV